jgi:hypothetical protein
MVNFIHSWFQPATPSGQQGQNDDSSWSNTILAVGLGALALFTANAFDRKNPPLATVLRCAAGGIGLIWIFSRCCPTSNGNQVHLTPAPVGPPPAPTGNNWWGWLPPLNTTSTSFHPRPVHTPYVAPTVHTGYSHVPPAAAHPGGFPTVHRAPAQDDTLPMYQAPLTRGAPVHPVPTAPPVYTQPPSQAHTTFSHAAPQISQQARTTYSQAAPVPPPRANPHVGGFPTVHRASAQSDSTPMHAAPVSRGNAPGAFPDVRPAVAQGGSATGNDRVLFSAAVTRN